MTIEKIENILKKLRECQGTHAMLRDALDEYFKIVYPGSYPPIIEHTLEESFINGVCTIFPELRRDLEYFAWEAPSFKEHAICRLETGEKFDAKKIDEYAQFIFKFHFTK
jgi:hypothetical protein